MWARRLVLGRPEPRRRSSLPWLQSSPRTLNRQTLAVVIPLSVATMTSGCSIFFVKGPTGAEPANCTDTYGWPALDMGLTLLEGVRTGLAINASDQAYANAKLTRSQDVALGVGWRPPPAPHPASG